MAQIYIYIYIYVYIYIDLLEPIDGNNSSCKLYYTQSQVTPLLRNVAKSEIVAVQKGSINGPVAYHLVI